MIRMIIADIDHLSLGEERQSAACLRRSGYAQAGTSYLRKAGNLETEIATVMVPELGEGLPVRRHSRCIPA